MDKGSTTMLTKEEVTAISNHLLNLVGGIGPYNGSSYYKNHYDKVRKDLLADINTIIKRRMQMTIKQEIEKEQLILEERIFAAIVEFEIMTGLIVDDVAYPTIDKSVRVLIGIES